MSHPTSRELTQQVNKGRWDENQCIDYLTRNYCTDNYEDQFICKSHHDFITKVDARESVLELGAGPTIYPLIPRRGQFSASYLAEFNTVNFEIVNRWLRGDPSAHDWRKYLSIFQKLEKYSKTISEMQDEVRCSSYTNLFCDVHSEIVLPELPKKQFDLVSTNFCPESITTCYQTYCESLTRIAGLIKPNGYLIMLLLKNASHWLLNGKQIHCLAVNERMLVDLLSERGLHIIELRTSDRQDGDGCGDSDIIEIADGTNYSGMISVLARKSAP
jgi:hypothetical protein